MKKKTAPKFTWEEFTRLSADDPNFDPFAFFSFHQTSLADRSEIARRIIESKLSRARPAKETT